MTRKRSPFSTLLNRWQPPEQFVLMITALFVGLATGIGAILFRYLISGVEWIGYHWVPDTISLGSQLYVLYVPAIGGLLVGLLVYFFAQEAKGHGVPEVMAAVALRGGRIRPIIVVVKSLASAFSIGSGGSVGREGPIVQIGSAIGSSIGQALGLSDERTSNLVACGAAGGIAATFNAPISGVIFALEVIMGGRFSVGYFSSVVVSAVTASVMGRIAFGDEPAFAIPFEYGIQHLGEYLLYPILGILGALVGVFYTRVIYFSEDLFDDWTGIPEWIKPAIGGLMLGVLALVYPRLTGITWTRTPQVFNVGYDVIESVLANQLTIGVVFALLILKLIATTLTLGSGGSGGVFAPSLFVGCMLGGGFALIAEMILPGYVTHPGAYALVGMAAVFAATAHAPITAVLILFELTGDYRIILPLMLTVVISTLLSQYLLKGESIYTLKLTRRGVRLRRGRDVNILENILISDVMTEDIETIQVDTSLDELSRTFARTHRHGLPILDKRGKLWGIVTIFDLDNALQDEERGEMTVESIGTSWPRLIVTYPDETVQDALSKMGTLGIGRLPVVSHEDPYQLLGLVRRDDIIRAYDVAVTRRSEIQQRTKQAELENESEAEFVELPLSIDDPVIGQPLKQIAAQLPTDCILVSVRRNGRTFIPHGDTVFEVGDQITAFVSSSDAKHLFHCFHGVESDDNTRR